MRKESLSIPQRVRQQSQLALMPPNGAYHRNIMPMPPPITTREYQEEYEHNL